MRIKIEFYTHNKSMSEVIGLNTATLLTAGKTAKTPKLFYPKGFSRDASACCDPTHRRWATFCTINTKVPDYT